VSERPVRRLTPGLERPLNWDSLPALQAVHDNAFHDDVMRAGENYQMRHSFMHLDKILGAFAAIVEKAFHGENLDSERAKFIHERLPDLVVFVAKLHNLVGGAWPARPRPDSRATFRGTETPNLEWLELQLEAFERNLAQLNSQRRVLMRDGPIGSETRRHVVTALAPLAQVAASLAAFYGKDLLELYRARMVDVEQRKRR